MSALRRLSAACSTVLVASALVVAPFLAAPAGAAELLQDGGFESATGNPPNSPGWTEADSISGSPLCSASNCSATSSTSPPRSGNVWARFGASTSSSHTASLSQTVLIPTGTASLTYWYRNGAVTTPYTATLQVRVDGTTVKTHTEVSTAQTSYSLQTVDLSAYANDANHTISFNYANNASGENRMTVDDVSLNHTPQPVTATPTVTSTVPASPSSAISPSVKGAAESGSTVTLHSDSACSSAALGSGSAASFAASGIPATVPANATTTIYARATKSGQSASACSSTSVSYTNDQTAPGLVTLTSLTPTSPGSSTSPAVKGTAEAGSTVRLFTTADCSGTPAATGTAAAFSAAGLTVTVAAGSTTTFKATATDAAGNASVCSTSSLTYVNDSTAPGPVVLTSVTPASPSPSTSPVVKGTAEAGSTVNLYTTAGCTGSPAATGTAAAFAAPGLTVTVAAGSTTTFKATATDAAGNASACSTSSLTYVNDSTAPPLVTFTSVTPASPNPSTTPVVKGTAEAGSTVNLYTTADCSGTPAATGTAAAFAAPGFTVTVAAGSTTTFKATATDAAGNASGCSTSSLTYVSDATAPPLVTFTSVTPASPNPSTTPVVKGTAEAGSTVRIYTTADCSGAPAATGTAAAFAAPGFSVTVVKASTTTFRATAADAVGNTSACSTDSLTYVNNAAQVLQDGGFEATVPDVDNPYWVEADSYAGSPLCTVTNCTTGEGVTAPRTGNAWAWFGGYSGPNPQTASLSQSVVIPVGAAVLTYWFRNGTVSAPFDAQLLVRVDGTAVKTHTEASAAEPAYTLQTVDLAPYADGLAHTLSFAYGNGSAGLNNMTVDDVALNVDPAPATVTPTVTSTLPGSPSSSTTPQVTGTAETDSTVLLYANGTCTGPALGTGSAAAFETVGITATVPANATTTIFAKATKAGQNASACSTTSVAYTHRGAVPETTLTTPPRIKVYRKNRKAKVTFLFSSMTAGATFQCSIDGKAYVPCTSGKSIKLKAGKHTFAVRAVAGGVTDPTPATYAFKVKRKK